MVSMSPVSVRSNQPLPFADILSPKAYPLITYLLQTFDKRPMRAYFMKGTLLPQPIFPDLSHGTSLIHNFQQSLCNLFYKKKKKNSFLHLCLITFPFFAVTPAPKRRYCYLNHGVAFIPLLCSHCRLICFAGYITDVSSTLDYNLHIEFVG